MLAYVQRGQRDYYTMFETAQDFWIYVTIIIAWLLFLAYYTKNK